MGAHVAADHAWGTSIGYGTGTGTTWNGVPAQNFLVSNTSAAPAQYLSASSLLNQ